MFESGPWSYKKQSHWSLDKKHICHFQFSTTTNYGVKVITSKDGETLTFHKRKKALEKGHLKHVLRAK